MLQSLASPKSIAGIVGATFGAVLIESFLRHQIPFKDVSSFLIEAVVMTLALPALLCLTQKHCVSHSWSSASKKCCFEDDEFTAEDNKIDNGMNNIIAESKMGDDNDTAIAADNEVDDTIAESNMDDVVDMNDQFFSPELDESTQPASPVVENAFNSRLMESRDGRTPPAALVEDDAELACAIDDVTFNVSSAGDDGPPQEHSVREEPQVYDFQVGPMAARMMQTGPSDFLLQVFREAATANGVQEKYKMAEQCSAHLVTTPLTHAMMSCKYEEGRKQVIPEESPKSTTASSEDNTPTEEMANLEIDQEYPEDEYNALLRDLGVPSDRGENDEDEAEATDHEDDEDEVVDDEYRAFLEEMGVPSNWSDHRDDEDEWLTEEEELMEEELMEEDEGTFTSGNSYTLQIW